MQKLLLPVGRAFKTSYGGTMNEDLQTALLMILGLQLKHVICDGPLQTLQMVKDKSHYGKPYGLVHAIIQGMGTGLVFTLLGLPLSTVGALAVLDGIIHYHVDYLKENIVKRNGWTTQDGPFWWALTTDQTLHHMTYVLLAWVAFKL
jgi:hypothetical protein